MLIKDPEAPPPPPTRSIPTKRKYKRRKKPTTPTVKKIIKTKVPATHREKRKLAQKEEAEFQQDYPSNPKAQEKYNAVAAINVQDSITPTPMILPIEVVHLDNCMYFSLKKQKKIDKLVVNCDLFFVLLSLEYESLFEYEY
jgi:hypothetical protein